MTKRISIAGGLALAATTVFLAGCATSSYDTEHVAFLAPDAGRIVLDAKEFRGEPRRRVVFDEAWQREEYALYRGFGAQAELFYSQAAAGTLSLEYGDRLKRSVDRWNNNRGQDKQWGVRGRVYSLLGDVFYRTYRLTALDRACAGFSGAWDYRPDDPFRRPSKVLFGYYCAAPGASLTEQEIEALIAGIRVDQPRRPDLGKIANGDANGHAAALRVARGPSPEAETGLPDFPFYLARYYNDYGGNNRQN